jgi:formate hydrogenlyase transcriptional activator
LELQHTHIDDIPGNAGHLYSISNSDSTLPHQYKIAVISMPALREHREDIPALVSHFVKTFSDRMKKQVDSIPPETMSAFQWHSWSGNIRELRNMVECAVILSQDGVLHNPLHNQRTRPLVLSLQRTQIAPSSGTWEDSDHALIVETLEEVGWVVGGPRGAAAKLGLKRTTLLAKMKRLGISRPIPQEGTDVVGVAGENAQI